MSSFPYRYGRQRWRRLLHAKPNRNCILFRLRMKKKSSGSPRADNRMNPSAAQVEYIQGAAERIGLTLVLLKGRVIFDHHDGVHSKVLLPGR